MVTYTLFVIFSPVLHHPTIVESPLGSAGGDPFLRLAGFGLPFCFSRGLVSGLDAMLFDTPGSGLGSGRRVA